jgi:hypothetical protein
MNWDAVGAVAELLAAAAVAASLAYVAVQVRLSNRLARAEAFRAAATQTAALTASQSTDPVFRSAFHKAYVRHLGREELTEDERVSIALWFVCQLSMMEQVHREVSLGILSPDAYGTWGEQCRQVPYLLTLWPMVRANYSPEFVGLMDSWIGAGGTP